MNTELTSNGMKAYAHYTQVASQLKAKLNTIENLNPPVIAFSGKAGSGKDTAALALTSAAARFNRLAFADPIREMIERLGVPVKKIYETSFKNDPIPEFGNKSLRFMLQTLGTEWGRNMVDLDIWLTVAKKRVEENKHLGLCTVFSDLRFDNEAQAIKDMGGIIIQVSSLGNPDICTSKKAFQEHESEKLIDPRFVDFSMTNHFYDNPTVGKYNFMSEVVQLVHRLILDQ